MTTPKKKLPDGWQWVKLGDVCIQDKCTVAPNHPTAKTLQYIGLENIESNSGRIVTSTNGALALDVKSNSFRFDSQHVLYGKLRPYLNKVAVPSGPGRCTTELIPLLPTKINREYLALYLRTPRAVDWAMQGKTGSRMPRTDMNEFMNLPIPLPPLAEQKRIVATLEAQMVTVERARKAAEEALEAVKALNASFLRKLLPSLGQQLPRFWKWAKLGEVCEKIEISNPENRPDDQFTYVDISSINRETKTIVSPSLMMGKDAPSRARRVIRKGDVLIATTRPNLNSVALVPSGLEGQICSTGLCVLHPNKQAIDSRYLYRYITHESFVESLSVLVSGAMYPAVTDKQVFDQTVPLPPLAEQQHIVSKLESQTAETDRARQAAEDALDNLRELPNSLLRRAFAGEI